MFLCVLLCAVVCCNGMNESWIVAADDVIVLADSHSNRGRADQRVQADKSEDYSGYGMAGRYDYSGYDMAGR